MDRCDIWKVEWLGWPVAQPQRLGLRMRLRLTQHVKVIPYWFFFIINKSFCCCSFLLIYFVFVSPDHQLLSIIIFRYLDLKLFQTRLVSWHHESTWRWRLGAVFKVWTSICLWWNGSFFVTACYCNTLTLTHTHIQGNAHTHTHTSPSTQKFISTTLLLPWVQEF